MSGGGGRTEQEVDPVHPAVVFTVSPTGLAVARSLAPRGVVVYGVDENRREIGHYSRWFRRDPRIAYGAPGPELLSALVDFGARQSVPPVIFLGGDAYIEFVAENHETLRKYFVLADSMRPEVNSVFLNKSTFYERCRSLGVAMPRTFFPKDESDARLAAEELRYPAIVKPTMGHLFRTHLKGEKLVEVDGPDALLTWWRRLRDWGGESVLQEVIPGPEANIFVGAVYSDAKLEVRSLFTARKSRQYPPMYGSGSYMEACWSQEIADLSADLVKRLQFSGVCGTEFKWDERDREWKLIEINPRPTLWYSLPRAAGVDVVWDAYCDLVGKPNPVHVHCQDDRVRWQLLVRDLVSARHFYREGELGFRELVRTALSPRRKDYAILSLRDPGTLFGLPANTLWKYWTNMRGAAADG
jgi:predicted ATP-grasp superfamily ATP-dependent carboligase